MNPHPPKTPHPSATQLQALGQQIRARRKALRVSSTAAAEAAGVSRVTLHRIEKGEPSVAGGAWAQAMAALGMELQARHTEEPTSADNNGNPANLAEWIPVRVLLHNYPQLKALAWQVHGTHTLSPLEAWGIYERNARHLDMAAMSASEHALLQGLRTGLGGGSATTGPAHV